MRSMSSGCRAWRILRDARRADNKRPVVSTRSRATGSLRRWAQFVCGNSRSQFIDRRTSVCHSRRLLAMAMTNAPLVNGAAGAGKARGKARASGSPRVRTGAWAARAAAGAVPRFRDTRYTKVCSTVGPTGHRTRMRPVQMPVSLATCVSDGVWGALQPPQTGLRAPPGRALSQGAAGKKMRTRVCQGPSPPRPESAERSNRRAFIL